MNYHSTTTLQQYHHAWLEAHPERTKEWLRKQIAEGFQVHHLDGNRSNNAPSNLALMDGVDHVRIHGIDLRLAKTTHRERTIQGIKAAKDRGVNLGGPKLEVAQSKGSASNAANTDDFSDRMLPVIRDIQARGITTLQATSNAMAYLPRCGVASHRYGEFSGE